MTDLLDAIKQAPEQDEDTLLKDAWILGFDTETTGVAPGRDAICSATLVLRNPATGYEGDVIGEWIVNPHRQIAPGASKVNGFTNEYLQEHGAEPTEAVEQIATAVAAAQRRSIPLLAYNAPFDVQMLKGDLQRWQLQPLSERLDDASMLIVDPLVIDRKISKRKGHRTLTDTTFYYGVQPHGDFHDATADTIAAVDLLKPMTTLYPQVGALRLGELMQWQRIAYDEWRESFNQWQQSRGRNPVHDGWFH